jgi:hypothetical protein
MESAILSIRTRHPATGHPANNTRKEEVMHAEMRKQGARKLLMDEARFIREMDRTGAMSRRELARKFGMNVESIARICRGDTYPDPEGAETGSGRGIDAGLKAYRMESEGELQAKIQAGILKAIQASAEHANNKLNTELALSGNMALALKPVVPPVFTPQERTAEEIAEDAVAFADISSSLIRKNVEDAERFAPDSGGEMLDRLRTDIARERGKTE